MDDEPKKKRERISPGVRILYIDDLIAAGIANSVSAIWRLVAAGKLPKPFSWRNRSAWREAAVMKHLDGLQKIR